MTRRSCGVVVSFLAWASLVTPGCGGGPAPDDASTALPDAFVAERDAPPECMADGECDDGLACNGEESCTDGRCLAGTPLRCDDMIECTTDFCSEEVRGCVNRAVDADGDGAAASSCVDGRGMPLGDDCDDTEPSIRAGALEVCDEAGVDEDCDATTRGGVDRDSDGFEDQRCCNGMGAGACGDDCNDAARAINPMGTETCNGLDDDCNGTIDEGVQVMVFRDADGDGRGDPDMSLMACASRTGYSAYGDDCDDANRLRSPLLPEVCDAIDNDCDGVPDPMDSTESATWYEDLDGDGFGSPARSVVSCAVPTGRFSLLGTDCNDEVAGINPARAEDCNAIDDDCNGRPDYLIAAGDYEDDDEDGTADARCVPVPSPSDCDDLDPLSGGGSPELCDGRDNDCDAAVDEMVTSFAYFRDEDGDGFGAAGGGVVVGCVPVAGYSTRGGDCADADDTRHPGASEACNLADDDCDAAVDEAPASLDCDPMLGRERACLPGRRCQPIGCLDGLGDCDGNASDCETSLTTDMDCGSCGNACGGATTCTDGTCR